MLVRITTVPLSLDKLLTGQLKYMQNNGFKAYMISSASDNIKALEIREEATFLTVNMSRSITLIKDFIGLVKLVRILYKLKPSIVHTHTPKAGLLGTMAAWLTGTPVRLHTVAGLPLMESTGFKRFVLELVEKLTYFCANRVYPNSQNLKEFIINNKFCSPQKLKVIGNGSSNGIDAEYFSLTDDIAAGAAVLRLLHDIREDDFVFVFIGRLVKDKGIEELISGFVFLAKKHINIKLLLVGPTENELDPLSPLCAKEIEQNIRIILVGYQADIRPYLALSHVLVLPSYREGFPNVPMQAGCFDLPCIVTDINGCNEIIEDETNGLIIRPKNTADLEKAMGRLITDKQLYIKLKSNARKMIVDRYEQTAFWSLLLEEYKSQLINHGIEL